MNRPYLPAAFLVLVGSFLIWGKNLNTIDLGKWRLPDIWNVVKPTKLEGTELLMVHEKKTPTADEVLAVRAAPEFVASHKLGGFLDVDKDDAWAGELLKTVGEKWKITPPFLAACVVTDNRITEIRKVVPWKTGLEDILK